MANGLFDDKKKAEIEAGIDKMIAAGKSDEEIQSYIDQEKVKLAPAQAQQGAPVQDGIQDSDSNLAPGSSVSPEEAFSTAGAQVAPQTPIKDDAEIGGWENLKNNVQNVYQRILGFDDRLALAAADTFETLLGKDAAEKLYSAMPTYDSETGEWLDTPDEVREAAYRELAQTEAQNKQTVGLIDSWENGDAGQVISAAAGAGLNLLSTMVTSGLTAGAGIYTDMVADAIVDANNTKAERLGISTQELYERGENEFALPAAVGTAGGLLERMGIKGVSKYINKVAAKNVGGAVLAMANNSGREGLTEWLQFGLERYNNEKAKGNEDAAGRALEDLFTREGAEMALQGAVGALVGGTAGKAGKAGLKKAGVISSGEQSAEQVDETPAQEMSDVQDTPEYAFNPKDNETKYKSKVKATEEAQQEVATEQEGEVSPEVAAQQERDVKREKATQDRETRRLVQELSDEYEGTAQDINPTDQTAYVLKGLEQQAGIKTVDEAADLSKTRQRDVLNLVTKASIGLRSAEETAALDQSSVNIYEAAQALEQTSDVSQQEYLQQYIDDEKAKQANVISNYNRKVLLASPTSVATAIEAASELERLTEQEANIEENTQLPDHIKEDMLRNIQDRKNAAFDKGETARAEIEKTSDQNADLVDDNSKYLNELLNEEIADNDKKTDAIISEAVGLGLIPDPDGDLVTDESLVEGRQAITGENGVKEYGKTLGGNYQNRTEAIQAGIQLQQAAKAKGYKADVNYVDVNPERPGGETQVVAEVYAPRQEGVVESVNKLKAPQVEEEAPVEEGAEIAEEQAVEGQTEQERGPLEYVADFAPEARETALPGGEIFLPGEDAKQAGAYRAIGGLKKRGHSQAKFDQIGGGFLVTPGPKDTEARAEYSLVEDAEGRAHRPDGKFANGQEREVARVRELPLEAEDGATFNLDGSVYEDGGLVVPIASKNMKASELTPEAIENFKQKYADYMGPASKVGIYKFPNQDQVSIDLNVIAPASKRDEALAIGTRLGQESLFDLDTFENIKTGQTGASPKTPTAAQAKNISNQLADVELSVTEDFRTPTLQEAIQARQDIRGIESKGRRTTKEATPEQLAEIEAGRERTGVIQEATPALGDEASEAAFDRTKVEGPRIQNIIDDLGKQPKLTEEAIAKYNNGDISNNDFIKRIARAVLANVPKGDKELEGFALEKLVEQVDKGNFKDKNLSQVFSKAKSIGRASKTDQRKAYGENVRAQRIRNVAKRAEDAFFAENGFEPGNVELADYINDNVSKYKLEDVTPEQIENSKFEEVASGVELAGIQGAAREIGQTRAAKEAGFDQLTDAVLPSDLVSRVDDAVSDILAARPIVESEGKGRTDEAVTAIKKAGTRLDKTVGVAISDLIPASLLKNNFAEISEILNLNESDWDNLSRAQKQDVKRKVVKGLAKEAEDRLGKQTTPSQESEFSIEEGSATRVTDTGAKATQQVNSHGQSSKVTKREIADAIRNTDFDNDWVQWSPGKLNPNSDKARRMPPSRVAELLKQPETISKFAAKKGLKLRPDAYNKGLYHIYKPGKPGSPKIEASIKEFNALSRANKEYIDNVTEQLKKAWPGIKIASTAEAYAKAVAGLGVPSSQIKGSLFSR